MTTLESVRPLPLRQSLSTDNLAAVVEEFADNPATWVEALQFSADERWWTRLHSDDVMDVWLITWARDTATELHDHGESAGAFNVIAGSLIEARLARTGGLMSITTLPGGTTHTVEPGAIHDVSNPSRKPAISIHAYSPPLREMTYYAPSPSRPVPIRTVATLDGSPE
jgi:predicted metal-dependent enzyme (double-stranded beta helix superfamily)